MFNLVGCIDRVLCRPLHSLHAAKANTESLNLASNYSCESRPATTNERTRFSGPEYPSRPVDITDVPSRPGGCWSDVDPGLTDKKLHFVFTRAGSIFLNSEPSSRDTHTHIHTNKQTNKQTHTQTHTHTHTQTHTQTYTHTNIHTHTTTHTQTYTHTLYLYLHHCQNGHVAISVVGGEKEPGE